MDNTKEYLRTELRALEDQIAAVREQIRQEDGLAMDRSQKQLKALLFQQKEMEEKLQALEQSS
jgi:DNA polymerase I-like protein with 3'-5' exonuclease and polymerase domains